MYFSNMFKMDFVMEIIDAIFTKWYNRSVTRKDY